MVFADAFRGVMLGSMLILHGTAALSQSRLKKLLARIREHNPQLTAAHARFVHFADAVLNASEEAILTTLLGYGPRDESVSIDGHARLVTPRPGTISPWSSKATDIAHLCGVTAVRRLERGVLWTLQGTISDEAALERALHDRMTEAVFRHLEDAEQLFAHHAPRRLVRIPLIEKGKIALEEADRSLGLALSAEEIEYLAQAFLGMQRDPTDVELMMFAQANSEHCRHKIFNAEFNLDGETKADSLFRMIRRSTEHSPKGVLSAYSDNASVIEGTTARRFFPDPTTRVYSGHEEPIHILMKVETHNHPTAI